jgi:hypothetical protein
MVFDAALNQSWKCICGGFTTGKSLKPTGEDGYSVREFRKSGIAEIKKSADQEFRNKIWRRETANERE